METVHRIGDPVIEPHPSIFELIMDDHVQFVDPRSFGIKDEVGIRPSDYFITSGDALEKAKIMERDLWQYAGVIRSKMFELIAEEQDVDVKEAQLIYRAKTYSDKLKKFADYVSAVWSAAGKSRSLVNALARAKATNCFLETEWSDHKLYCIPKNPKAKK